MNFGSLCIKNVNRLPINIVRNIMYTAVIFHMLVGFGMDTTTANFVLTRIKFKVTEAIFQYVKNVPI